MIIRSVIGLIIFTISLQLNKLKSNISLNSKAIQFFKTSFNSLELYMGRSANLPLNMNIDINGKETLIFDVEGFSWGTSCTDQTDCEVQDDRIEESFLYLNQYFYKRAKAYVRVGSESLSKEEVFDGLDVNLVQKSSHWFLKGWGSVGLNPQGDFANYLRRAYEEDTSMVLLYSSKRKGDEFVYTVKPVVNPVYKEKTVHSELGFALGDSWNKKGDIVFGDETLYKNAGICFTDEGNVFLYSPDYMNQCLKVQRLVCDGKTGKDCKKDIVDYSKAPVISILIEEQNYDFDHTAYLYEDKDGIVQCRFKWIFEVRNQQQCGRDTEFAVGKEFFKKYIPVMTYKKDGSSSIVFLNEYQFNQVPYLWVWIFVIGIPAIIAACILIHLCCLRKPQPGDDEVYLATGEN